MIRQLIFKRDSASGCESGARCQIRVSENAEHPGPEVGAGLESAESAKRLQKSLLHQVFRIGWVAGEPGGDVVQRRKQGQRHVFKLGGLRVCLASLSLPGQSHCSMLLQLLSKDENWKSAKLFSFFGNKTGKAWFASVEDFS